MPKVIQFKVQLFDIEPEIWRRIVLPASFTLFGLHAATQAVMGWQDNWLSNRIFKSYDEIVALCCEAWNKLIDQPWKIMSIGQRKRAHGF